ncbi:sigma-54-dependent transcriptional regulator [Desulfomonile tiedjei]|uniref:Response regulator with CheY-like receiver, AAA-type ATPase, and DNA-binding domains n=1 Tax=Desulfomonile tiedjei (strain ATCC 49306 / DSM 6799 / DCB-1) TaxID=706587 RepID=I4C9J2_DESTA|nr:sigma-54 dependent transcriptional regulator [Desulfomonile tiedjei]AFM26233.1 response regulator with CheY-like receiver, AAA-type ATPase, and DNA-binding domains [Desulfomonile tiedjei DSM 6799]
MSTVLIVDDEKNYLIVLEDLLMDEGYDVLTASSGAKAIEIIANSPVDTVLSDIKMPGMTGIELLERISALDPDLPVILMTAFAEVDQAVDAMKKGALDHIQKPFDNRDVKRAVARAVERRSLVKNIRHLESELGSVWGNIIGKSKAMENVFTLMKRVADTPTTVLIAGESGTGKELVARGLHKASSRNKSPFVPINCGAVSESLLESELFGYEKGAFTGAASLKQGKFEFADQGTLFLDEVGEMSLNLQVKLLRVLQEHEFQRVGGNKDIRVDVRIIAATNRDLKEEVENNRFRGDLFFRLNVVRIDMPPLRERREDIPFLVAHFLNKFCEKLDRPIKEVHPDVMSALYSYSWPGNVRELENVIERALVLCRGDAIMPEDLPLELRQTPEIEAELDTLVSGEKGLAETLDAIEERIIRQALKNAGNVQAQAAKILGISRSNLQYKLKKYGLLA